jgi:hypothetical protein
MLDRSVSMDRQFDPTGEISPMREVTRPPPPYPTGGGGAAGEEGVRVGRSL